MIEAAPSRDFFRHSFPASVSSRAAIRDALVRASPDPDEALFAPLRRELDRLFDDLSRGLDLAETDAETHAALHAARLTRPLAELARLLDELDGSGA